MPDASTTPRRTALVTGASAGIGEAFAEHLAARGFDLVLTARRLEVLREVAEGIQRRHDVGCRVIPADLTDPEAPRRIFYELARDEIEIDVLVNNAGYGLEKTLLTQDWREVADVMQVMSVAWLHFMQLAMPSMIERGWGRVANIASLAAFAPDSPGSLYSGIKAQMVTTSRGMRSAVRGTGVHVTAVCPGYTHTEFHARLGIADLADRMPKWMWQNREEVVAEGWRACERNRPVVVTGTVNKMLRAVLAVTPTGLVERQMLKSVAAVRSRGRG
ncbi:MAG TPA: short-chain dehydrogenase [Phycisphaerales bacterium]|nr:short-chain dehydrogenase [Phycisphaerales bacterium]